MNYRAEMGEPPMPDEGPARRPMTRAERMAPMRIGGPKDLTPEERERISRNMPMDRVPGEKSKPKKYASGGSVSSRADGCAQRGKTKGKMI